MTVRWPPDSEGIVAGISRSERERRKDRPMDSAEAVVVGAGTADWP